MRKIFDRLIQFLEFILFAIAAPFALIGCAIAALFGEFDGE